jgi:hypothetical protein
MQKNTTLKSLLRSILLFACPFILSACSGFRYGWSWSKAQNSYNLVTGSKDDFGDMRVRYNRRYHKRPLDNFIAQKGQPGFIYEYRTDRRSDGIRLYYPAIDSVFSFEEPRKSNIHSVLVESRKMDEYERQTYERLKQNKH